MITNGTVINFYGMMAILKEGMPMTDVTALVARIERLEHELAIQ